MEILLELIENFFILWFVLVCFKVNVFKDIGKIAVVTSIATFCAMLIQQLRLIAVDESLNMLLNMVFGIVLYAYLVKCFYWNEGKFFKAIGFTMIYFFVFILACESIWITLFNGIYSLSSPENSFIVLIITLPYRAIQVVAIYILYKYRRKHESIMGSN